MFAIVSHPARDDHFSDISFAHVKHYDVWRRCRRKYWSNKMDRVSAWVMSRNWRKSLRLKRQFLKLESWWESIRLHSCDKPKLSSTSCDKTWKKPHLMWQTPVSPFYKTSRPHLWQSSASPSSFWQNLNNFSPTFLSQNPRTVPLLKPVPRKLTHASIFIDLWRRIRSSDGASPLDNKLQLTREKNSQFCAVKFTAVEHTHQRF